MTLIPFFGGYKGAKTEGTQDAGGSGYNKSIRSTDQKPIAFPNITEQITWEPALNEGASAGGGKHGNNR